jgi:peptide/nickel transport system permease protein
MYTEETVQQLREQLGLNDPLLVQYGRFFYQLLVHGDLGRSFLYNRPVVRVIMEQWPATIQLALAALFLSTVLGVVLGVIAALHQGSWIDTLSVVISVVWVSVPSFWLGLLLILFFCIYIPLFPLFGESSLSLKGLVLPAFALGMRSIASIARLVRSGLLEVLGSEYITTARAKGLHERVVIFQHALKNALIPAVTVSGLHFGYFLGGSVIIEAVFARQGVGYVLKDAVLSKDYPLVQAGVLFMALLYGFANLITDITYTYLDPRIREV